MIKVVVEAQTKAVACAGGLEVGSLSFSTNRWHYDPRIFYVRFALGGGADAADVAAAYGEMLRALESRDPLLFYTGAPEDSPLLPVLRALGFREFRRVYGPTFDVASFELSSLDASVKRIEALGYRIVTLAELEPTPAMKRQLHRLFSEVYADTATVVPATPEAFSPDEWWRDLIADETVIPEAYFVVLDGHDLAGFGNLYRGEQADDGVFSGETGTFGTARRYRHHHRDLMLAVKAREIAYAKLHGYPTLRAEIDADNPLILQICAELPFVQGKDYVSLVRAVNWTHV